MKKKNMVIIGGVIVLGIAAFWFLKNQVSSISSKVTAES
jgi:hypothetical protein